MKRFLILCAAALLITIGLALAVHTWFERSAQPQSTAIQAIPMESSIIIKINQFENLAHSLREHKLCHGLSRIYELRGLTSIMRLADSLFTHHADVRNALTAQPLLVALCPMGKEHEWLAALQLPNGMSRADIMALVHGLAPDRIDPSERMYNQTAISNIRASNNHTYAICTHHGVVIISSSKILTERAINQIDNNTSLTNNTQFNQILNMAGKGVPANLFVQLRQLPASIAAAVHPNHRRASHTIADMAMWAELDLGLSPDHIMANGLATVADSTNSYLRLLCPQRPVQQSLQQAMPAETGTYLWWGIPNQAEHLALYRSYLERKREIHPYTQRLSQRKKQLGAMPEELFKVLMKDQMALVHWPSMQSDVPSCWYIVANTDSPSAARRAIEQAQKVALAGQAPQNRTMQLERGQTLDVLQFPAPGLHRDVWGSAFDPELDRFCCFIDNLIIYAQTPEALARLAKNVHRNHTLGADVNYRSFATETVKKSNFCLYINPLHASELIALYTTPPFTQLLISAAQQGLTGLSAQLVGGNPYIFAALNVAHGKMIRTATNQTQWVSTLHAKPLNKPQLVVNHNTREREIFVQDTAHNVYLIGPQGRLLWERRVQGAITGDVQQVDAFRNGKLQLVFSTQSHIYMIDRLGRDVEGFPIALPTKATNPLTVVDYDGNRTYRLLQACADRHIYMFDAAGKPVEGWAFGKTETVVKHRIGLVRSGGKDFLVIFDRNRIYLVNRRGEERAKPSEHFCIAQHGQFGLGTTVSGMPCIVTSDSLGVVRTVTLDGHVKSLALQPFGPKHTFCTINLNSSTQNCYVVLDGQQIRAFTPDGKPLFSRTMPEPVEPWIGVFDFGEHRRLGLVAAQADNIYMLGPDGRIRETFPLQGCTPFSVAKQPGASAFSLFVGTSNSSLVCYSID